MCEAFGRNGANSYPFFSGLFIEPSGVTSRPVELCVLLFQVCEECESLTLRLFCVSVISQIPMTWGEDIPEPSTERH